MQKGALQMEYLYYFYGVEVSRPAIEKYGTLTSETVKSIQERYAEIQEMRQKAIRQGVSVTDKDAGFSSDYVVNVNELQLANEIEELETILGTLDGQLSLKNATIKIEL